MSTDDLASLFPPETWRQQPEGVAGASGVFLGNDMLVAVVSASDAAAAAEVWPEVQQSVKTLRASLSPMPDCYLLIVIRHLSEDDYSFVRSALDDTLVCRKVVIPLEGRSLAEALRRDFPLLAPPLEDGMTAYHSMTEGGPDDEDLDLLDRKSAEHVAEVLLVRARARRPEGGV